MATTEPRTKAMLAIRRNMRKEAAGLYPKMSEANRRQAVIIAANLASAPHGRARKVSRSPDKPDNITPSTILYKKPNNPKTLSIIKTESKNKRDAKKAALKKSLASTGRTGPKKEITQPEIKKIITSSKSSKNPRSLLEIKKSLEGKVVRTGDSTFMDAWKYVLEYVESGIKQKNAQTGNDNTIAKTREEIANKEDARQTANAAEREREGAENRHSTKIQISDVRRTEENNSSRKVAHPEGEYQRVRHVQETADADIKATGGQGKYIKPADNSEQGAKIKK